MTEVEDTERDTAPDLVQACHRLLLQLAGRAPDDLLTHCRGWLSDGELADVAHCVTFWAVSADAALTEDNVLVLSALLTDAGADSSGLTQIRLDNSEPFPYYSFASDIPLELGGSPEDESCRAAKARAKVEQAASADPGR